MAVLSNLKEAFRVQDVSVRDIVLLQAYNSVFVVATTDMEILMKI